MLAKSEEIKEEIEQLKQSGTIIIVEGIKDKRTLSQLGLKNIFTLSRKPIFSIIEELAEKKKPVTILTDFDKKGKELYQKLNSSLQKLGVKIDNSFRQFLRRNTRLSHIEGLASYINNLEQ